MSGYDARMTIASNSLVVDGVTLELKVVRKRVKNINARLHGRTLSVSAPHRVSKRELDETVLPDRAAYELRTSG